MDETYAKLISCKPLKNEFQHLREINISSEEVSLQLFHLMLLYLIYFTNFIV